MSVPEFVPAAKNGTDPGLCKCGCGEKTEIAEHTNTQNGWVKGQPRPYISGHSPSAKKKPARNAANSKEKDPGKPESQAEMKSGLDEVLGDYLDDDKKKELAAMLWEACQVKRRLSLRNDPCKECGCQHVRYVEDYDFNRSMKALDLYMTRVAGRPGTAAGDDAGVIVKLVYVGVDE